jgi:hypothetical protein
MRVVHLTFAGALAAFGWSCSGSDPAPTSSPGGAGSAGASTGGVAGNGGSAGSGATSGGGSGGSGGSEIIGSGGTAGVPVGCDPALPNVDDDLDGYSEQDGDCDDCDNGVNPSAAEVIAPFDPMKPPLDPKDDDCDNLIDDKDPDLQPCDAGLALESVDPIDAVKAIGLCDHTKFLKEARWVVADGTVPDAAVDMAKFHLGHGLHDHFGANDKPREGALMLALSSGTARNKDETGFFSRNFDKGYSSNPPLTFSGETPACPGVLVSKTSVQDAAGLELEIQAPSNVSGLSFHFNYRTYDFPEYLCTPYSDAFWVNFVQGNENKNVAFDDAGNLIGVSSSFITQCDCPPPGAGACLSVDCKGITLLEGTDFDGSTNPIQYAGWSNAGTEWLVTTVPVVKNKVFKLRFVVFDSGVDPMGAKDHRVDSMVLIDQLRWHVGPIENKTVPE